MRVANNLPVSLTSFVGREQELVDVREELRSTRLLTLTGAGGCGKTRLALRAASEVADRFADGVWWIDLAPVVNGGLVGAAVAGALGVRPLPGTGDLRASGDFLSRRRSLLVLDNCEHLLEACAEAVEALLKAAPELVVLATSRAPLDLPGETDWRVPPLSLPGSVPIRSSDAVQLFTERASKLRPGFAVDDGGAELVSRIVTDLDGLPLAIELAAARVRTLSLEQISAGLSDRFSLLTTGPRTADPRQRTLRGSVDWSHALLSEPEQLLLRRLAPFAGGFTLDAVAGICIGDGVEPDSVLDSIGSLVGQSLVVAEHDETTVRFGLLETVRQYALERLAEAEETEWVRDRHRDWFLALAERAAPQLETSRQVEWLERLDSEAANLVAALDYALISDPGAALRFCSCLYRWWCARGRLSEAELACGRALEACGDYEPALRARVLFARAYVSLYAGEVEAAESHAREALALAEEVGERATAARARCYLGDAQAYWNPRAARSELSRAAELAREAGDQWALVEAVQLIALTYLLQADHVEAASANDQVAELAERLGDPFQVARRWLCVCWMAEVDGRFQEVRDAAERLRVAAEGTEEPFMQTLVAWKLALVEIWEGEPARGLARAERQLERARRLGIGLAVPVLYATVALAELAMGRIEQARARLDRLLAGGGRAERYLTSWALGLYAETLRLLGDPSTEAAALEAQGTAESIAHWLWATRARLTLGRLATDHGDWRIAQRHVLAHLDACVAGGHTAYIPAGLDALAEVMSGLSCERDAIRLLAAAERARAEIGVVRVPLEEEHWTGLERRLRAALDASDYEAARSEGAALSTEDVLAWARRARGPRRRPPGGWEALTPTELKVVELVAEGLTNSQIAERMFISPGTVKTHLRNIFKKVDVHRRSELTAEAVRRGPPG
jgi:predicted ATPase/DNA-binding CsgD family transcriptional regulator